MKRLNRSAPSDRNLAIYEAWKQGVGPTELGKRYGISADRVSRILTRMNRRNATPGRKVWGHREEGE